MRPTLFWYGKTATPNYIIAASEHREGQAVVLRHWAVGTRRQHHRAQGTLKYGSCIGIAEQRYRLVERVSSLYVGEYECIGLTVDRRLDAFLEHILSGTGTFHVHRPVYDTFPELSLGSHIHYLAIAHSEGEMLLLHFLRTVAQSYARFLDAQSMTDVCHIVYLSYNFLKFFYEYHYIKEKYIFYINQIFYWINLYSF